MRRLLLIGVVSALALAKPETYSEKEDFQFSRSSTDEGTKSGFYGAKRGNMGGNYERAHNMDGLAQHQMGTALRQIEGELGDTSAINKGRVFTAGSSRGIYGQGTYNLDSLSGRNFQESGAGAESQTHSAFSNGHSGFGTRSSAQTAGHAGGYDSYRSRSSGYNRGSSSSQFVEQQNREALENLQRGRQAGSSAYSQSEYDENSSGYNQAQSGRMSSQNNYEATKGRVVPVRVVLRPGSTVNVPVNAEAYDNTYRSGAFDQNSINGDAEVLTNTGSIYRAPLPTTASKHYESEYRYRKEWEKHSDGLPAATPLVIPDGDVSRNSELYEDSVGRSNAHGFRSSAIGSQNQLDYSASNQQSKYQSGYKGLRSKSGGGNFNTNGATSNFGSSADLTSSRDVDTASEPKSYQSSYSYKKSWERQGDPYVIKPVGGDSEMQRLTAGSNSQAGYRSHQYGSHAAKSHYSHNEGEDCDCDEQGNVRVVRSIHDKEDLGQQTQQVQSSDFEELGQRPLSQDLKDFGQTQDLGQRTQNTRHQVGYYQKSHNKLDKAEDLQQHINRNEFSDFTQQTQQRESQNLEDLGQQVQRGWDDSTNVGQHAQNGGYAGDLYKNPNGKVDNFGQKPINAWHAEDLFKQQQRTSGHSNNYSNLNSQIQRGHTENTGDSTVAQQANNDWYAADLFQQPQNKLSKPANVPQHNINLQGQTEDLGQQTQNSWAGDTNTGQQIQGAWNGEEMGQGTQSQWRPLETGKTTEKSYGLFASNTQRQLTTPSSTNQRKPAFNTEELFKPVWEESEQSQQNSDGFTDWSKLNFNGIGKDLNDGKSHSQGTDEYSFQHSSQNWGNARGESSHSVQTHREVQYQFTNKQSTETNLAGTTSATTESNKNQYPWTITTERDSNGVSIFDKTTEINRNVYPRWKINTTTPATPNVNRGRGDIDAGDSYQAFLAARPTTQSSLVQHKPYKTPAEIETLSLTKDHEKPTDVIEENPNSNTNSYGEDKLRVVGLNNQWLEDQRRHNHAVQTTTQTVGQDTENRWHARQPYQGQHAETEYDGQQVVQSNWNTDYKLHQTQDQSENLGQQTQTNWYTNDKLHQSRAQSEDVGQQVVQSNWNTDNKFRQNQEKSQDLGQQTQTNWNTNDKLHESQAQSEDVGQQVVQGWNSENLQQNQRQSEDLGQQIQTGLSPNEKLSQQADHHQLANDFYSEHHQLPKAQEVSTTIESQTVEALPEMTTKPSWKKRIGQWFGY